MPQNSIAFNGADNLLTDTTRSSKDVGLDSSIKRTFTPELLFGNQKIKKGKVQSAKQTYFQPSISYHAPSGFNCSINSNYFLDQKIFDEFDMMAGYDFNLFKFLKSGTGFTKYFYAINSLQSGASVSSNINFYAKHDFNWLESELDFDVDFLKGKSKKKSSSSNTDYTITWENYHSFDFDSLLFTKDELSIVPEIILCIGTQNVNILYFQRDQKKFPNIDITNEVTNASKFKIVSFEFVLPIDYYIGKLKIEPCVHYFIPQNQPAILSISNTFYFTLALAYEF